MRILILTTHLNTGGISNYVINLARGLKEKGNQVRVASSGGQETDKLTGFGIEHINLDIKTKSILSPKVLISLYRLLKMEDCPDIIHSQTRVTQVLGYLYSKIKGSAFISTCHGFFKPKMVRKIFPCWGDKTIAISEAVAEHLENDLLVNRNNIEVIHNGIDVSKYMADKTTSAKVRASLGLEENFVVGIVARLSIVKGHRYLLHAFKVIARQYPFCKLLIVGEGDQKNTLEKLISKLRINHNVMFLPSVEHTRDVLSAMDLFVMPSINEGLGFSILEAMASRVPVIGSNVGGIKNIITNNQTGLLVESQNITELACAMKKIIDDPTLQEKLAENGQKLVSEKFTLDAMVNSTEFLYQKAVFKKRIKNEKK